MKVNAQQEVATTKMVSPITSDPFDIRHMDGFGLQAKWTDDTPIAVVCASATDVHNATEIFDGVDHGFTTGLKAQLTTSNTRPTGLELVTDYFMIRVDDDHFKVATTYANAIAGTVKTFSDDGVGNQTWTPVALAGDLALETSFVDDPGSGDWNTIPSSSQATSVSNPLYWHTAPYMGAWVGAVYTQTAGTGTMTFNWRAKGPAGATERA